MKTSVITSILLAISILANAKVPVLFNAHPVYNLVDVTITDTATILTMEVKLKWETKALTNKPFIKSHQPDGKPDQAFKHGYIDGDEKTPLTLDSRVKPADKVVMFFEPLPSDTKTFFFSETTDGFHCQPIIGIRLDGQAYHASSLPPTPPVVKREHLLPYKAKVDTATLSFDLMMPTTFISYQGVRGNQWADEAMGYKFNYDSMSNINASYVNMLPHTFSFEVNNRNHLWVAAPGSNTRIIFDAPGYAEAIEKGIPEDEAYNQALHIYEAPLPEIYSARKHVDFRWQFLSKFDALPFDAYADSLRAQLQRRKHSIAEIPELSGAEREFLQLYVENRYISEYIDFLSRKKHLNGVSEDDMARFEAQFTLVDPTAGELLFASSPAAIYLVDYDIDRKDISDYLIANGLNDAPFVREVNAYFNAVDSIKNARIQADNDGICETPDCAPEKILESIVAQHRGKTLLVDFWATWCGPCMMGMEKLEPYKDDLMARGVDFVYITPETSPLKAWKNQVEKHRGSHYRIPMETQEAMNIPEFQGSIPFYLIYRPDGSLATTIEGWGGVERMLDAIEAAQQPQNDSPKSSKSSKSKNPTKAAKAAKTNKAK